MIRAVLILTLAGLLALVAAPALKAAHAYRAASACDDHGGTVATFTFEGRTASACRDGETVAR